MLSARMWLRVLCVSSVMLGAGLVTAAESTQSGDENLKVKVYTLKHLATQDAVMVLRAIYEVRRVAELRDRSMVIVADTHSKLDAIGKLLERIDVPPVKDKAAAERPQPIPAG